MISRPVSSRLPTARDWLEPFSRASVSACCLVGAGGVEIASAARRCTFPILNAAYDSELAASHRSFMHSPNLSADVTLQPLVLTLQFRVCGLYSSEIEIVVNRECDNLTNESQEANVIAAVTNSRLSRHAQSAQAPVQRR